MAIDELIGTPEAAAILGVTDGSVRLWIQSGRLPAVRLPGGRYKLSRRAIERLAQPVIQSSTARELLPA
jgi:excisionase family DNA binding protein